MPGKLRCVVNLAAAVTVGALAGCTTAADMSYGEYRFGPGYQAERVYERRIYADTDEGLGSQECRTVVRRHVNRFGETVRRGTEVCDDAVPGYAE